MRLSLFSYTGLLCILLFLNQKSTAQRGGLEFVANEGQWTGSFLYKGYSSQADIYLEPEGITYVVGDAENPSKMEAVKENPDMAVQGAVLNFHAYRMKWIGGNPAPEVSASKKSNHYYNYFLGSDKTQWKSNLFAFAAIDYKEVYPDIDFHISSDKGLPKYDFIVKPGGDPKQIHLKYEGVEGLRVKDNMLQIQTSVGLIREMAPYAFQYIDGVFTEVDCYYSIRSDGTVGFEFPDGYNKENNLTIDPVIVFASLTGSTADNWGFTATYDQQGNLYAGGIANALGYPVSTGAFQVSFGGGTSGSSMPSDVTISKFNSAGNALIYSTYLGGNQDDMPHSLVVDNTGNLIIAGKTLSSNFPTSGSAYDNNHNGAYDIFLTKFNASGTGLIGSTYLGGSSDDGVNVSATFFGNQNSLKYNYGDGSRSEVIIDRQNNIYLAASSRSNNFPTTATAAKATLGGLQDGIFAKFNNDLSGLIYSTYIGGSNDDAAYVLALDTAQTHIYIGGGTMSSDFHPSTTTGAWQTSYQGGASDGFISRFLNAGSYPIQRTSFIGTGSYDQVYGLQTDLENGVYAMGQTLGSFPVSPGVYSNTGSPQFLIKLDSTLGSSVYSTVFGSGPSTQPNISPVAFLVDTCQNVYISGWGASSISPGSTTNGLPLTSDAFQSTTDGSDFYFIVFSKNALGLLFGSYFGSSGKPEHVDGGTSRFNPQGEVYQAICASCGSGSAYPATPGAYATTKGSNNCNLGALKIAFNLGSVNAEADVSPSAVGCAPFTVQFGNNSSNATSYEWNFGDGSTGSNTAAPTHTFSAPGTYTVRMIAINPNACKTRDTVYLTIDVSADSIAADFDFLLADTCTNPNITLTNTSAPLPGQSLTDAEYKWFFGDGNTYNGPHPPVHTYSGPGVYDIMLIMISDSACNSPDTLIKQLVISQENVGAEFDLPDSLCVGDSLHFSNTSTNASSYHWSFGDGQNSTEVHPVHPYMNPGTYTITLIASNPETCNKSDTLIRVITVEPSPTAQFMVTPLQAETNEPFHFHNQSLDAVRYLWTFGDGLSSTEENPTHQYLKTGNYTVCLTAYNEAGCPDKTCKTIYADVLPLADLPDAFSPNGDGSNDILYVRGYGIQTMHLKIFNRWGELVFSSEDQNKGWDGTYKGTAQEMDAYAYILEVNFWDGKHFIKKGNVTLLR